ncbi:MAG: hypothetical protein H6R21_3295, partial [Proteobacteria bacterium]|nr:hypothetical protein [Pseudomonadota bacterium]
HSGERRNPGSGKVPINWTPAFAGVTELATRTNQPHSGFPKRDFRSV